MDLCMPSRLLPSIAAPRYGAYWLLARPCLARLLFEVSLAARGLDLPPHVNVDRLDVRPVRQGAVALFARDD